MRPGFVCSGTPRLAGASAVACALLLAACSEPKGQLFPFGWGEAGGAGAGAGNPSGPGGFGGGAVGGGSGAGGDPGAGAGGSGTGSGSFPTGGGTGTGSGTGSGNGGPKYVMYASTDETLFVVDPGAPDLPLVEVGDFDCTGDDGPFSSMVDIAVDKLQNLWGITGHHVMPLLIVNGKVHCGDAIELNNVKPGQAVPTFYALTFAPVGVVEPQKEVLVAGNTAGELWTIDALGNSEKRGSFGTVPETDGKGHPYDAAHVGKPWELSGDIVFLANDTKPVGFATVRDCPNPPSIDGCSKVDTLIEIDMAKFAMAEPGSVTKAVRGKILKEVGCDGALGVVSGGMFGIAAYKESVYGFSRAGSFVRIGLDDGGACLLKNYFEHDFSGAGVSTLAPVVLPPLE